jgi:hypothetical protein
MLTLLLTAVLLAPVPVEDDDDEKIRPPDPAVVEAMVDRIQAAYAEKDTNEILSAFTAARAVLHKDVAKEVAKGIKKKDKNVQKGAIECLRWMKHPEALKALHDTCKRNKTLMKDDDLAATVLKAIGQHGDPGSIDLLCDNIPPPGKNRILQACVLGLGRIRTDASLEAAIGLMRKTGPRGRRASSNVHIGDMRTTLVVLTGVDNGPRMDAWIEWWNDNKKTFEVSAKMPEVPKDVLRRWQKYWEIQPTKKERGGRGGE